MPKFSLRSLLFICCYFAICSMIFVTPNLWVGWLLVIATAIWMARAMIQAFQTHDHFSLGFAVVGSSWLIIWLGFAIEASSTTLSYVPTLINQGIFRIRDGINWAVNLPRPYTGFVDEFSGIFTNDLDSPILYDLYETKVAPSYRGSTGIRPIHEHNSSRLAVCVTALFAGCVGGAVTWLYHARVVRPKRAGPSTPKSPEIERA